MSTTPLAFEKETTKSPFEKLAPEIRFEVDFLNFITNKILIFTRGHASKCEQSYHSPSCTHHQNLQTKAVDPDLYKF